MKDTGERLIPQGHLQTLAYGEHISRYSAVAGIAKGKVVLDIASGAGYGTKLLSKFAKQMYGIDYSLEAIKYSKEHYSAKNITYMIGDALKIPLDDESVDVVVSLETIEHLKSPAKFITEVKRILKKDGQFIVSTPNDDEYTEGNEFHLHEFGLLELQTLIKRNFKNAEFYYQGTYFGVGIFGQELFENGGEWNGPGLKTFGQPGKKAIYFLAIASDGQIEKITENVALADEWSSKNDFVREAERIKALSSLNAEIMSQREESSILLESNRALDNELTAIKTSKGWKILKKLYMLKKWITLKY